MNKNAPNFDIDNNPTMDQTGKEEPRDHEVKNVVFVIIALITAVAVALWLTL